MGRGQTYRNVFDPEVGFMRGRNRDGSGVEPFDPIRWGGSFAEGSTWQCGWAVQHDVPGLIELMGGREAFLAKLNELLETKPLFDVGSYGQTLEIDAENNGPANVFVTAAPIDGLPCENSQVDHRALMSGGRLCFTMSDLPPAPRRVVDRVDGVDAVDQVACPVAPSAIVQ